MIRGCFMCLALGFFWAFPGCAPANDVDDQETGGTETGQSDTGGTSATGLKGRAVEALVAFGSFHQGSGQRYFVSDSGLGVDLCRLEYTVSGVGERSDCDLCDWAFDVALSNVQLLAEQEPGCLETLGVDSADLGSLEGQVVSYGYSEEYFGHAQVVFTEVEDAWVAVANAVWAPNSGMFSFDWQEGYVAY